MGAFDSKVAVITGGAHGIGRAIADAFLREGAAVHIIDLQPGDWFVGDVGGKETLERFAEHVIQKSGHVDYLINNALPLMKGINECAWEEFSYALAVGVTAPFYLTKLFMPHFAKGAAVINISSSRDRMSQPQTESYTAAKGGIAALTHALAISLAGKVRVNSISPGWIDTTGSDITGADAVQQPVGRAGKPEDIAEMALFLCSEKAGFITGENICIDGGMTRLMIYTAITAGTMMGGMADERTENPVLLPARRAHDSRLWIWRASAWQARGHPQPRLPRQPEHHAGLCRCPGGTGLPRGDL